MQSSAVPAPARKPLTICMLESADLDEQIRMLYEYIFPLVEKIHPTGAKHITRLVIEGENNYDLLNLIVELNRLRGHDHSYPISLPTVSTLPS
ncbi:polyadenylate-binding protein 1-like [Tachysurus ichikawai]